MVDVVDVKTLFNGRRSKVFHLTGVLDTAHESNVAKIDISTFTTSLGAAATYTAVDKIEFAVSGNGFVLLEWDHDTDDEMATLSGQGCHDWTRMGGNVDPRTTGGTGDILLSTGSSGAALGASNVLAYDITIYLRMKA